MNTGQKFVICQKEKTKIHSFRQASINLAGKNRKIGELTLNQRFHQIRRRDAAPHW
jgi:hypothetical protein